LADVLSAKEAQRILDATKPSDLVSVRDRAILLLRLGLRTGDVAALRFCDVLWARRML
jgi:integrase